LRPAFGSIWFVGGGAVAGECLRLADFFGGLQTLLGGNITIYTKLCEETRSETYHLMRDHAQRNGANAIIGMRYDATEVMAGLTEVLCYGTAVVGESVEAES